MSIQRLYPDRTATCRQCPHLDYHPCAAGRCKKLTPTHSTLVDAISRGECPEGKFDDRRIQE